MSRQRLIAYALGLALLVPGVARSPLENQGDNNRDASFNVNGLRSELNNFLLDGVDNNAYGTSNQGFSNQVIQPNPDALAEFRTETNNYSAEYGRTAGAVINASIKSGTNQFHGELWEFNRNEVYQANNYFLNQAGKPRPKFRLNIPGGNFGGHLGKNTFFFVIETTGIRTVGSFLAPFLRNPLTPGIFLCFNMALIALTVALTSVGTYL